MGGLFIIVLPTLYIYIYLKETRRYRSGRLSYLGLKMDIPSGKRLHNYGKSPCSMGNSTISMVIFNSYVSHYQRVIPSPYKATIAISRTLATSSGGASLTPVTPVERQLGGFSHGQNWVCLKMGYCISMGKWMLNHVFFWRSPII